MSNLINKAKDALSGHSNDNTTSTHATTTAGTGTGTHGTTGQHNNPHSTNAGPHSSNALNKADPRIDSDRDNRNDPTSHVGGYGTQNTHTGAGSGLTSGGAGVTGTHHTTGTSTNAGPHNSNVLNKADPRYDSDRDHRNDPTSRAGGYGTQNTHTGSGITAGTTGVSGTHGTSHGGTGNYGTSAGSENPRSTNAGPHSSNLLNKLDPQVDSDRDGRNDPTSRAGGYGQTQGAHGNSGLTSGGVGGYDSSHGRADAHHATTHGGTGGFSSTHGASTGQYDNPQSSNHGPHSSNLANKLNPTVDSDRDGRQNPASAVGGYGQTQQTHGGSGLTSGGAGYGTTGTTGTHGYDATGTTGTHGHGATSHGTGAGSTQSGTTTASGLPSTQKAHESTLLNRLDPRVQTDKSGNPTH